MRLSFLFGPACRRLLFCCGFLPLPYCCHPLYGCRGDSSPPSTLGPSALPELSTLFLGSLTQVSPPAEDQATATQREKKEAHDDRIVAVFNRVMVADGFKVLKHRRSAKAACSRVIRFVPSFLFGGYLEWRKPFNPKGAKNSRVPLDAITQVELEACIVWISAGDERVGFETSRPEDADIMYKAICILVDECHA